MKKTSIILFAIMLMAVAANAKSLVLTLSNGTLVYYLIDGEKNPVMKFEDGKCVVNADTYEFSGIKNFYISETDDPTAVTSPKMTKGFSWNGNILVVEAGAKNVHVYSADGAQADAEVDVNGCFATVNLSGVPAGAYIIKVGDSAFKVLKK